MISAEPDRELDCIARTISSSVRVAGRAELEVLFDRLLAASDAARIASKTLDLLGHSTARTGQLRLGDWVIDAANPAVTAMFRELAERDGLRRLGIHALRLLGCRTSGTDGGRATICALADLLGIEVHGTDHLLYGVHYDEHGFREIWEFLLTSASALRRATSECTGRLERWPRTLDVGALPAQRLGPSGARWPRRVATAHSSRQILGLIRRDAGAPMPGVATPVCELALESVTPGEYHVAHVLLDSEFIRFYPDGAAAPGVVYPVDDARELRRILDGLPAELTR